MLSLIRDVLARLAPPSAGAGGSTFLIQNLGFAAQHSHGPSLIGILLGVLIAVVGVLLGLLVALLSKHARAAIVGRRERRRRMRAAAGAEERARAMMSELCPFGWRAQLTLFGPADELPPDAPRNGEARVALDWAELDDDRDHDRIAVVRRVWAATIAEALDAMVADRRTDETLEQIERGAVADGTLWPDF